MLWDALRSVRNDAARPADEPGLVNPVGFVGVPALGAHARRVRRIDEQQRNPGLLGLVDDEVPELSEGPGAERDPLALAEPYPHANPIELFQGSRPVPSASVVLFAYLTHVGQPASRQREVSPHARPGRSPPVLTHPYILIRQLLVRVATPNWTAAAQPRAAQLNQLGQPRTVRSGGGTVCGDGLAVSPVRAKR